MGKILVIKGADFSAVSVGKVTPIEGDIAITVVADGNGTVTGSGYYETGDSVTITATPAYGYNFVSWNDGNTNPTRTIVVGSSAQTYTATFVAAEVAERVRLELASAVLRFVHPYVPGMGQMPRWDISARWHRACALIPVDKLINNNKILDDFEDAYNFAVLPAGAKTVKVRCTNSALKFLLQIYNTTGCIYMGNNGWVEDNDEHTFDISSLSNEQLWMSCSFGSIDPDEHTFDFTETIEDVGLTWEVLY